jgi:hypothetical protein
MIMQINVIDYFKISFKYINIRRYITLNIIEIKKYD